MKYQCINGWTKESMIAHIKKEFKGKSVSVNGEACLYRASEGKKCAVGMFIPEGHYYEGIEGNGYYDNEMRKFDKFMPLDIAAMTMLQSIHDSSNPQNTLNAMLTWIESNVE